MHDLKRIRTLEDSAVSGQQPRQSVAELIQTVFVCGKRKSRCRKDVLVGHRPESVLGRNESRQICQPPALLLDVKCAVEEVRKRVNRLRRNGNGVEAEESSHL